ncbi:hypothetical protein Tco_0847645, partial [Tanacetum coccineum]
MAREVLQPGSGYDLSPLSHGGEILLKMNLPDHRIKQRWRWRHLVPVESIHHPMLTLNVSKARRLLKNTSRKLTINGNESVALISPKWNATTATKGDILLGNAKLQEIKTTRTRKSQEGLCLWKHPLPQLWCHVMVLVDFKKSELMVLAYKLGLESVEEKLDVYKENESIYSQDIKVLKFEIECKDIAIRELRKKLEITQKEKDGIQFNVEKFENASKSLNKLIESQIVDNYKKGLGYNAVLPPYTGNFMPSTPDLSFTGLDEFVNNPVVENRKSDEEVSKVVRKSNNSPIIEDWVSDSVKEYVS